MKKKKTFQPLRKKKLKNLWKKAPLPLEVFFKTQKKKKRVSKKGILTKKDPPFGPP